MINFKSAVALQAYVALVYLISRYGMIWYDKLIW